MKLSIILVAALFIGAIAVSGCTSQSQQPLVEPTTHTTATVHTTTHKTPTVIAPTPTPTQTVYNSPENGPRMPDIQGVPAPTATPTATPTPTPTTNSSGWMPMRGCTPTYVMKWVGNGTVVVEPAGWTPQTSPAYNAGSLVIVTKPCSAPL